MPVRVSYRPNPLGLREFLLTDPILKEHLRSLGDKVLEEAVRLAPVGGERTDKHPGAYRDSLYMSEHTGKTRMSVRVGSTDQKAWWIEYGTAKMPKHAVLRRALDSIHGIEKSAADYAGIAQYDALHPETQRRRQGNRARRAKKAARRKR